jgi:hypothetical protein
MFETKKNKKDFFSFQSMPFSVFAKVQFLLSGQDAEKPADY